MNTIRKAAQLMILVYINEKTVLDMLAIIEDGFSMVSQVNYSEHNEKELSQKGGVGVSTSSTILSKFLRKTLWKSGSITIATKKKYSGLRRKICGGFLFARKEAAPM